MKARFNPPDLALGLGCWAHVYTDQGDPVDVVIKCIAGCWVILVSMLEAVGIYL